MALPTGVTTGIVTAGAPLDFAGVAASIDLVITPTLGGNANHITWQATGQPIISFPMSAHAEAGEQAQVVVPHVDQPGFIDGSGNAITNWSYRAQITVTTATRQKISWTKVFQIVQGQASIDLDLVPDGTVTSPQSAPIETVTSVNGQTGAVVIEAGGGGSLPTGGTAGQVLAKNTATDGDAGWKTLAAADVGAVAESQVGQPDGIAATDADGYALNADGSKAGLGDAGVAALVPDEGTATGAALAGAYGAVLPAASGDDTAAINSVLTAYAGRTVRGRPGESYTISAPLVIHSGTTLDMTGCTVTLTDGVNDNMLYNYSARNPVATGTATATVGSNVITTALAAQAAVGQSLYVDGAVSGNGRAERLCGIIGAVDTTAGTVTVTKLNGDPWNVEQAVTDAVATLYDRDVHVTIGGGTWDRGYNGWRAVTPGPNRCTFDLKRIDGLVVRDVTLRMDNAGYNLAMGDVTQFNVNNVTLDVYGTDTANSDGVNINGGAWCGSIRNIYGWTHDDFVSFHCLDNQVNMNDVVGDISDVLIENVCLQNSRNFGVKLRASGTTKMRRVTIRGVHGSLRAAAVSINNADGGTNDVSEILIEDIDAVSAEAGSVNILSTSADGTIIIRDVKAFHPSGNQIVYVNPASTLGTLIVDGLVHRAPNCQAVSINGTVKTVSVRNLEYLTPGTTTQAMVSIKSATTVDHLQVTGVRIYENSGSTLPVFQIIGSVGAMYATDIYVNGGGRVLSNLAGGVLAGTFERITLDGARDFASIAGQADLVINDLTVKAVTSAYLIAISSTTKITVRGQNLSNPDGKSGFTGTAATPARVIHPQWRVDLSTLARNDGDAALNTNAGLSCGKGQAISNGTSWKNVYTGAEYTPA